jgi:hypothetical protein
MTFLPVVERELRVSARKRSTFWLRVTAALVALVIGIGFMILSSVLGGGTAGLGKALFNTLTWLALAATLPAGVFFTADSLSEEKREGTLGFLFLTELRGYDVAAGKLLATSLRGSYALVAFFPVLATTLLMGGVTGTQFWKATLALVNVLFVSLAAGLFVSSISRDSQKSLAGASLMVVLVSAGGPLFDACYFAVRSAPFKPILTLTSPVYPFLTAGAWGRTPYWASLLLTHFEGWLLLAFASFLVKRSWQDRGRRPAGSGGLGAVCSRDRVESSWRLRRKLLDSHPVVWLACRERWPLVTIWAVAILAVTACALALARLPVDVWMVWYQISGLFVLGLYLWAASQACRLFVEGRRGGFLELLLGTPLGVKEASQGQWRALKRVFAAPTAVLLVVHLVSASVAQQPMYRTFAPQLGSVVPEVALLLVSVMGVAAIAANLAALCWFGMWMGLTSKNTSLAVLKTIVFVQILPWLVISFASGLLGVAISMSRAFRSGFSSPAASATFTVLLPFAVGLVASVLALGKDVGLILWARRKLYTAAREQVLWNLQTRPPVTAQPTPSPPPTATPPPPLPT